MMDRIERRGGGIGIGGMRGVLEGMIGEGTMIGTVATTITAMVAVITTIGEIEAGKIGRVGLKLSFHPSRRQCTTGRTLRCISRPNSTSRASTRPTMIT